MTANTFTCRRFKSLGTFEYSADFNNLSSPITVRFQGHNEWQPVPFIVAAGRDRTELERMIADYFR